MQWTWSLSPIDGVPTEVVQSVGSGGQSGCVRTFADSKKVLETIFYSFIMTTNAFGITRVQTQTYDRQHWKYWNQDKQKLNYFM